MESVVRTFENIDWITIVLGLSLLILILNKLFFYTRFMSFISLPFNNKYIFIYGRKDIIFNWFNILWSLFMGLNLALFLYHAFKILEFLKTQSSILTYITIFGLLVLFFIIKIALQLINAQIFNSNTIIEQYIFKKISYLNYSGLIMFFANIFLTYVLPGSMFMVSITLLLIIVINIFGWINLLKTHRNFIASNFFYFILYLCTLEISPLVILANYLQD